MLRDWHKGLPKVAPRLRTKKGAPQRFSEIETEDPEEAVRRRRSTANRTLTILKAALNHAWHEQKIASDAAWRPVTAFKEADAARVRYLTIAEAQRLMNAAEDDLRKLVRAALATGARFGELAAATVGDFNPDGGGTLHIRTSKSGKGRHIVLTEEGLTLFSGLAAGHSPRDRLLPKADGSRWLKSHQTRPMKEACKNGKIDPPASFHVLRHTYASLMIMNGAPLMVVARNLGHADTRMVERHYGHLAQSFISRRDTGGRAAVWDRGGGECRCDRRCRMSASSPMQPWPFDGKVSNEWFDRGAWLFQAAETFADDHQIAQFRQQVERFAELRDGETPQMFEGSSNISGAARKKELLNRLVFDEERNAFRLYLAFKDLLQMTLKNKLGSGSLVAFGARGAADADFIWIPPQAWHYLDLHLDEGDVVRGEGMAYCHVPRHRS